MSCWHGNNTNVVVNWCGIGWCGLMTCRVDVSCWCHHLVAKWSYHSVKLVAAIHRHMALLLRDTCPIHCLTRGLAWHVSCANGDTWPCRWVTRVPCCWPTHGPVSAWHVTTYSPVSSWHVALATMWNVALPLRETWSLSLHDTSHTKSFGPKILMDWVCYLALSFG